MTHKVFPDKHPSNIEPFHFVWCDIDGTNSGAASDMGELQGETIASYTVTVPAGITKTTDNKSAVNINGVSYSANTVVTAWLSGGTAGSDYDISCEIVTSGSPARTLKVTWALPVRS